MRDCYLKLLLVVAFFANGIAFGGPTSSGAYAKRAGVVSRLTPERFRCILVGDSQTTEPSAERIRTQIHRWDAPIVGELVCVGSTATGFVVNNSNAGISNLSYSGVFMNEGWPDGGPNDFLAPFAASWACGGDIVAPGFRVGRYRLRFGSGNTGAPWNEPWGINNLLVARIAVRTSPMCIDAVETRAERGGVTSGSARSVHKLSKQWGVQVIEQVIPVDFNPMGDDVGIGLYFPNGSVEQNGQVLQVLGVVIERVDSSGNPIDGTFVGYQGRGGWNIDDHLNKISIASRAALIEMVHPDYLMIMLGHNIEPGGAGALSGSMSQLLTEWESAFQMIGRRRPVVLYVVPWAISSKSATAYLLELESVMGGMAASNRRDIVINYLERFKYFRPDVYDPSRYQLDGAGVHPGDIPTAVNLSEDLYQMLFFPNRLQK